MADEEVATRAPESDAAENHPAPTSAAAETESASTIPGDTKPDQGASLGEHCTTDRPTPAGEKPTGEITKLAEVDCYIAKPADYPHAASKLLLLLTGGTGVHSTNNQLQADKFATEGFVVVMPDQFDGDPAPNSSTAVEDEKDPSLIEQVKLRAVETAKSFVLDMWLARHGAEKVLPLLNKVVTNAKELYADAVANGGGVYGVGYCFGAKYIMILAGEHADSTMWGQSTDRDAEQGMAKTGALIKAGAVAHGTLITREDVEGITNPVWIGCVENDPLFPEDVRQHGEKALKEKKIDVEFKDFKNVPHGFAVLGDYAEANIKEAQQEAYSQMLGWLNSH